MTDLQYQYFTGKFEGHDKTILFYQSWRPVFSDHTMVFVHGLGEHSGRYQNIIKGFSNSGFGFYGYDLRGHGKSKGQRGYIRSFAQLTADLRRFLKLVSIHEENKPIVLFGHSLGGLICLKYIIECETKGGIIPSGLILSNPTLKLAVKVPKWKESISGYLSVFAPRLTLYNELDLHYLSHDKKVLDELKRDKLCHQRVTSRFYKEMLASIDYVKENAELLRLPTLFLLGGEDGIVNPQGSEALFKNLLAEKKQLKLYPTLYHELHNEVGKEQVFSDMKSWMKGVLNV